MVPGIIGLIGAEFSPPGYRPLEVHFIHFQLAAGLRSFNRIALLS